MNAQRPIAGPAGPRWVVRVPTADFSKLDAGLAITHGLRVISFRVPAAGPEIELTFEAWGLPEKLLADLRARGITVLAHRKRPA